MKQLAELEERQKDAILNVVDRVNLAACLIHLGRNAKAQELLETSLRQGRRDNALWVPLLLNLAAVYQEDDSLLQRALGLQREALDELA